MSKLTKVVGFIVEHRRPIGMIIGGLLSILGMEDFISGSVA
jgi:hypothetical protein